MKQTAYFALGCFWKPQYEFSKLKGILNTFVGYMGGNEKKFPNPSYEEVCSEKTGYAETVMIEFDDSIVSYEELLTKFWNLHNPTTINSQGPDIGTQYRSVIFYKNQDQKAKAEKSKKEIQLQIKAEIVTEIKKIGNFFKAEDYHQEYIKKGGKCSV